MALVDEIVTARVNEKLNKKKKKLKGKMKALGVKEAEENMSWIGTKKRAGSDKERSSSILGTIMSYIGE